jgi:hypothetical protein
MPSEIFDSYRHSGKFGPRGPVAAVIAALVLGFPLGLAYGYLMKWIPSVLLRIFGTVAYGVVFGFLVAWLMRWGKVRHTFFAGLCGAVAGLIALFFAWNGHVHTIFKAAPLLCPPSAMLGCMGHLYEHGSWGLRGSGNVTGVALAIVWAVEGVMIVGLSALLPFSGIADTPFCEQNQCWLNEEKKIDTLEAFNDPEQQAAFKRGDLGPLTQARPRNPDSATFARLTLKHSPRCDVFCTVRIENVTLKKDKDGNTNESKTELTRNLVLPQSMLGLITKFENFNAPAAAPEELPKAA